MFSIQCPCGHTDDTELFSQTPSGQPLPRYEYQCPKCYRAWRVVPKGEGWTTEQGQFIPPERACVRILPRI